MLRTGILRIDNTSDISRLDSGIEDKRLAEEGSNSPFGDATDFLVDQRELRDGDFIWVTGSDGFQNSVPVIFLTDAGRASDAVAVMTESEAAMLGVLALRADRKEVLRAAGKLAPSGGKEKVAGGETKKDAVKKSGEKKSGAKISGIKKLSRKGAASDSSTKKSAGKKSQKGSRKR